MIAATTLLVPFVRAALVAPPLGVMPATGMAFIVVASVGMAFIIFPAGIDVAKVEGYIEREPVRIGIAPRIVVTIRSVRIGVGVVRRVKSTTLLPGSLEPLAAACDFRKLQKKRK